MSQATRSSSGSSSNRCLVQVRPSTRLALLLVVTLALLVQLARCGSKGDKGEHDYILYNGNIVMRSAGKKGGGNFVLANQASEEVEVMPSFFDSYPFAGLNEHHQHHH